MIHPTDAEEGSDAWLRYLWDKAIESYDRGNAAPLAFVSGFLAHAAGDAYGHTMVNHYAGGPFELGENAVTHIIVEGYIALRSPAPSYDMSIAGVEDFIYENMVDARPSKAIAGFYRRKGNGTAMFPAVFSKLRSSLEAFVARNAGRSHLDPTNWPTLTARAYAKAWAKDIERGLREWPRVSTDVARSLFFNATGHADVHEAKERVDDYVGDYVHSMLGEPDVVADLVDLISDVVSDLAILAAPLEAIKRSLIDFVISQATGMSPDDWESYFTSPETWIARWAPLAREGRCGSSPDACKNEIEAEMGVHAADESFDWTHFPAAFNTVELIKLSFLSPNGRQSLMRNLGYPANMLYHLAEPATALQNSMVGFMKTLDGSK